MGLGEIFGIGRRKAKTEIIEEEVYMRRRAARPPKVRTRKERLEKSGNVASPTRRGGKASARGDRTDDSGNTDSGSSASGDDFPDLPSHRQRPQAQDDEGVATHNVRSKNPRHGPGKTAADARRQNLAKIRAEEEADTGDERGTAPCEECRLTALELGRGNSDSGSDDSSTEKLVSRSSRLLRPDDRDSSNFQLRFSRARGPASDDNQSSPSVNAKNHPRPSTRQKESPVIISSSSLTESDVHQQTSSKSTEQVLRSGHPEGSPPRPMQTIKTPPGITENPNSTHDFLPRESGQEHEASPSSVRSPRRTVRSVKIEKEAQETIGTRTRDVTDELHDQRMLYQPLIDSDLRLVKVESGFESDTIRLNLVVTDLKAPPEFEALSYVVGTHDASRLVYLRYADVTYPFPISQVLESALITLRRRDRDRLLWIDALSINQHDAAERSAQIKKMGQIFHAAANVCIWLGPSSDGGESEDALRFIHRVVDFKTLDQTLRNIADKPLWLALSRLMTRDWFTRRWCVQEMALARSATVYCGSASVPWSDFAAAAAIFESRWLAIREALGWEDAEELGDVHVPGASSLVNISSGVFLKDAQGKISMRCYDLETLLTILPTFAVTQPLDFVYSILSLGRDTYKLDRLSIPIDYSLSPVRVMVSVFEHVVKTSNSLDIICRPWAPNCVLPSWIPTVEKYAYTRRLDGQYERENADSLLGKPGWPIYSAPARRSSLSGVRVEWHKDQPILNVRACYLGEIKKVGERCVNGNIPRDWHSIGGWDSKASQVPDDYWRTIVAGRGLHGEQPPAWYAGVCTHCFEQNASRDVDTSRLMRKLKTSHVAEFLRRVQVTTWNRRLFQADTMTTWDRRLHQLEAGSSECPCDDVKTIGLGPAETRSGDAVMLLPSCSVPVVMRPCRGRSTARIPGGPLWSLIGACYLDGKMDAEAESEQIFRTLGFDVRLV